MKPVSLAAVVAALVALVIAVVALVTAPEGAGDVREKVGTIEGGVQQLGKDLRALEGELATVASARGKVPAEVRELESRAATMSGRLAKLEAKVAELAERRPAGAAAPVEIDQEKIGQAIRSYFEARMRARGAQQGGQQQRGGPPRVANNKVPQAAKDAAAKAVPGFKLDHVHPSEKTADGKATYTVDGNAGGKSYRIKVTADGNVLGKEERTRRGRGGRPPQGGGARPAGPANEPERF